jgi:hypothetical protein
VRLSIFFLAIALVGCTSSSPPAPRHSGLTDADLTNPWANEPVATAAPAQPERIEKALGSDECSIRLGDIEGALVLSYALNHQLPTQLADLRSEDGAPLKLTCPTSGRPYMYSAQGLVSPGRAMRILVWDDAPIHNGFRWCIFGVPSRPGELALDVKPIPESMFRTYAPMAQ